MSQDLTRKQQIFCKEYVIDFNGARAARVAGYSEGTARATACENLTKPYITDYISELTAIRNERLRVDADKVVQELAKIAFTNMDDFGVWDSEGNFLLKSSEDMSEEAKASLNNVNFTTSTKEGITDSSLKVTRYDKLKALEMLARHTGAFNEDQSNKGVINVTIGKPSE